MKTIKKVVLGFIAVFSLTTMNAQDSSLDLGLDVQSRYVWRGIQLGNNSASLQPYLEYSTGKFAFGGWAAYSTGGDVAGQEADLYATYNVTDNFSLTLTDYYFPAEKNDGNYFKYNGHMLELAAGVTAGDFGFTLATNIAGNADLDGSGDQSYSTYLEVSYGKTIGDTDFGIFAGGVFMDDAGYYLTTGSGLINLGVSAAKEIKITDSFSLPVNAVLIVNPDAENVFLTVGFSL
ncbi:MAG: hypothetical protein KBE41_00275 [Lutibacter sp.]|nr:hypothetical protein [Lutibacter sp.]MBP9599909.1 hypothetical protein [Lutibacter sp.]